MRDPYKPLWADSLADQPREGDDVVIRFVDEPEDEPPPRPRPALPRQTLIRGALAALCVAALALALAGRGSLLLEDVPSYWGDVPMTCDTVRVEQDERAVEVFSCRAVGGRFLPPGVYTPPESRWTSDITRRESPDSFIQITASGAVLGWARY